jgi:hypothetical protein
VFAVDHFGYWTSLARESRVSKGPALRLRENGASDGGPFFVADTGDIEMTRDESRFDPEDELREIDSPKPDDGQFQTNSPPTYPRQTRREKET